jgi:hypothetical protein
LLQNFVSEQKRRQLKYNWQDAENDIKASVISHFAPKTVELYLMASVIFQILQLLLKLTPFLAH